jgi:hypothetical protein
LLRAYDPHPRSPCPRLRPPARPQDGHLLLWLSKQQGLELSDVLAVVEAVKGAGGLSDGYKMIIDSIAGVVS